MPDIIEELEHYAKRAMPHYPSDVCSRAKREIEFLRREIKHLKDLVDGYKNLARQS